MAGLPAPGPMPGPPFCPYGRKRARKRPTGKVAVMLVIEAERFGDPEVLHPRQVPDPEAGPGQVVVRVAVADVLLVDTFIRSGLAQDYFPIRPPYVPGNGVAGQVIATGTGVDQVWTAWPVVAHTGGSGGSGGYAEWAVVPADDLIPVPDGLGLPEAAALLHDGATAFGLLERVGVLPGERVLVTAAAGGMGVLLVQLARAAGGQVIAAARGRLKLDVASQAGAEAAVDYSEPRWADQVRELTGGRGVDVVFDGPAAGSALPRSTSPRPVAGSPLTACPTAGSPDSTPRKRKPGTSRCTASGHTRPPTSGGWPPRRWPGRRRGGSGRSSGRPSRWRRPAGRMPPWRRAPRSPRPCW